MRHREGETVIFFGCQDRGGAHGVAQVALRLEEIGILYQIFCNGVGKTSLEEAGVPYTWRDDPESVIRQMDPFCNVWVTAMDEGGGIGIAVAKRLRQTNPAVKVVALTDYPTSGAIKSNEWEGFRPDIITAGDQVNAAIIGRAWPDYPDERIKVTGYPAFDRLEAVDVAATRARVRFEMGVPEEAFLATLFSNVNDTVPLAEMLMQAVTGKDVWVCVRPNPRLEERMPDVHARLLQLLGPLGARSVSSKGKKPEEAICASSVLVSPCSTAAGEAAVLRVPAINAYPDFVRDWYLDSIGGIADRFPWAELGVVKEATNTDELRGLISQAMGGNLGVLPFQEHYFPRGGYAARGAAGLIRALGGNM